MVQSRPREDSTWDGVQTTRREEGRIRRRIGGCSKWNGRIRAHGDCCYTSGGGHGSGSGGGA
jgi:hypothetical protein